MSDIFNYLNLPQPFEESKNNIWTNKEMSDSIFNSHFDPNMVGGSQDPETINNIVEFIWERFPVNQYRNVLDLGCGPGLYSEKFAKLGYEVTGVDISEKSINHAVKNSKKNNLDIEYVNEDFFLYETEQKFDMCLMIYQTYATFSFEKRKELLNKISSFLNEGGILIFDVPTMNHFNKFIDFKMWDYFSENNIYFKNPLLYFCDIKKYQHGLLLRKSIYSIKDDEILEFYDWSQHFTKDTIQKEMNNNDFECLSFFNQLDGTEYKNGDENLAVLCKKLLIKGGDKKCLAQN